MNDAVKRLMEIEGEGFMEEFFKDWNPPEFEYPQNLYDAVFNPDGLCDQLRQYYEWIENPTDMDNHGLPLLVGDRDYEVRYDRNESEWERKVGEATIKLMEVRQAMFNDELDAHAILGLPINASRKQIDVSYTLEKAMMDEVYTERRLELLEEDLYSQVYAAHMCSIELYQVRLLRLEWAYKKLTKS